MAKMTIKLIGAAVFNGEVRRNRDLLNKLLTSIVHGPHEPVVGWRHLYINHNDPGNVIVVQEQMGEGTVVQVSFPGPEALTDAKKYIQECLARACVLGYQVVPG